MNRPKSMPLTQFGNGLQAMQHDDPGFPGVTDLATIRPPCRGYKVRGAITASRLVSLDGPAADVLQVRNRTATSKVQIRANHLRESAFALLFSGSVLVSDRLVNWSTL
jgi:hypothetical protein